jgi:hypothetical protein
MKTKDIKALPCGTALAIGGSATKIGNIKKGYLITVGGWHGNRHGTSFSPWEQGKGIAIASPRKFYGEDTPRWFPQLVQPGQIRSTWAEFEPQLLEHRAAQQRARDESQAKRDVHAERVANFTERLKAMKVFPPVLQDDPRARFLGKLKGVSFKQAGERTRVTLDQDQFQLLLIFAEQGAAVASAVSRQLFPEFAKKMDGE